MKLGKKGSIGFLIGGVLAVVSSLDSKGDSLIPWQIKLFGGIALIIFGLSPFLFVLDNPELQKKNRKIALLVTFLLLLGTVGYLFLQDSKAKKKEYIKTYGTFEVVLNNRRCSGEVIFEGKKVMLQIKRIPSDIKIDGFRLYNGNIEIENKSIDMVCALMSDMEVIHCSTDLDLPKDNIEEFVNNGSYTIMYWMREPLDGIKISDISFAILNGSEEQQRIEIIEKK